jgi:hypothetical protein
MNVVFPFNVKKTSQPSQTQTQTQTQTVGEIIKKDPTVELRYNMVGRISGPFKPCASCGK